MKHVSDQNIAAQNFTVFSPIHLSATQLSFDGKTKSLVEVATARFNTTKIRMLSQHSHVEGKMQEYQIEILGDQNSRQSCHQYLQQQARLVEVQEVSFDEARIPGLADQLFKKFGNHIFQRFEVLCVCSTAQSPCLMIAPEKQKIKNAYDFLNEHIKELKRQVMTLAQTVASMKIKKEWFEEESKQQLPR